MGAKVQHGIGLKTLTQVAVEGAEGMGRRKTTFKQQAHGVTLVAKAGLHGHQHFTKLSAQYKQLAAIGQIFARCRPPLVFNLPEIFLFTEVLRHRNSVVHIGLHPPLVAVALKHRSAQSVHAFRHFHAVAFCRQVVQGVVERLKH